MMLAKAGPDGRADRAGIVPLPGRAERCAATTRHAQAGGAARRRRRSVAQPARASGRRLRAHGDRRLLPLDLRIVRGLAYYTGIVYEVFDAGASRCAPWPAAGGTTTCWRCWAGRRSAATGFGMGDVVLGILLEEKGKLPAALAAGSAGLLRDRRRPASRNCSPRCWRWWGPCAQRAVAADFSYKRQALGKQLKDANQRGAAQGGNRPGADSVAVKDLATGQQQEMTIAQFLGL